MVYMLVRLQCRYGKVQQFSEILGHMVSALERAGWRLHGAYQVEIGRLMRVYDLWEMPDANARTSMIAEAAKDPEFRQWSAGLADCLESEKLEIMTELPYSIEARHRRGERV